MSEDSIKLLSFWAGLFPLRVRLGLELKGLKYELIEEDLSKPKSELLLQSNPVHKKIPVFIHNGRLICESAVILQYVDEVWPNKGPAFLPKDPYERAQVRFWTDFVDKKFLSSNTAGLVKAATSTGDERQKVIEDMDQAWLLLEEYLNKKKKSGEEGNFFGGKEMNMVDLALSFAPWYVPSFASFGVRFPAQKTCPLLHEWVTAVEQCHEAHLVYPDRQKLADFVKAWFDKQSSAGKVALK